MMKEVGYGNDAVKRLEEEVKKARARLAELIDKNTKVIGLKQQVKVEQEHNADLKVKSWQNDSDQSKKEPEELLKPKRRTSRR